MESAEIVIVGGGIAGAALAYFLGQQGVSDVVLLEREATLGYHSSGRSAAITRAWVEDPVIRACLPLSYDFFTNPPDGFSDAPLFQRTGWLEVAMPEDLAAFDEPVSICQATGIDIECWSSEDIRTHVELLKPEAAGGGIFVPNSGNLATHELLSGYLKHARARGTRVQTGTSVIGLEHSGARINGIHTTKGTIHTRCVVNAAGAWADELYAIAGGTPIGITPMRRTVIVPTPPDWYQPSSWPFVSHASHHFYFKPEGQSIIASPMDEDPVTPSDARPDALRVAQIADLLQQWTTFPVPTIDHSWAGLRSFAPDRNPVIGPDPIIDGFFWLAGQGGAGITTSPAFGQIAAELLLHGHTELFDTSIVDPARFMG